MSMLISELEKRAEKVLSQVQSVKDLLKENLSEVKPIKKTIEGNFSEENGYIVFENKPVRTLPGSEKMLAVGGGIKASVGKNKEGQPVVEKFFFDKDRYSKENAEKWVMRHKQNIEESLLWLC